LLTPGMPLTAGVELPPRATASGRHAEVAMNDEFTARQRAISLRLAGRPVQAICAAVGRSKRWFHKWWRRYIEFDAEGLYDLTRARREAGRRLPPEWGGPILPRPRALQAPGTPPRGSGPIAAPATGAELRPRGIRPLPCERTMERVLQHNGLAGRPARLAAL